MILDACLLTQCLLIWYDSCVRDVYRSTLDSHLTAVVVSQGMFILSVWLESVCRVNQWSSTTNQKSKAIKFLVLLAGFKMLLGMFLLTFFFFFFFTWRWSSSSFQVSKMMILGEDSSSLLSILFNYTLLFSRFDAAILPSFPLTSWVNVLV